MRIQLLYKLFFLLIFVDGCAHAENKDRSNCDDLMKEKSYKNALLVCKEASFIDDPVAKLHLGTMHQYGLAVDKDINKAVDLFSESASLGNLDAYAALALIYLDSKNSHYNEQLAFVYTLLAAKSGVPHYQAGVGKAYADGEGVVADPVLAYAWYSHALCGEIGSWYKTYRDKIEKGLSKKQMDLAKTISDQLLKSGLTKKCSE